MPEYSLHVNPDIEAIRLDVWLAALPVVASRTQAARLIEGQAVYVNNQLETVKSRLLTSGDQITFELEDDSIQAPPGLLPEYMPLDIRFEDEHLIVLSKPAGLVCHPAQGHASGTLVNALIAYVGYENLAILQGLERPGIVHRLDKDTSGLMVVAKTEQAGQGLSNAIRLRELERLYLALVHGNVAVESGLVDASLMRSLKDRVRFVVSDDPKARSAVTSFKVLERFEAGAYDDGYCLLECKLFTGRTHQIRVHMAYTHHPCVGDALYGRTRRRGSPDIELGLQRQFLHSYSLKFVHPVTSELLEFTDSLPEELAQAYEQIKPRSLGLTDFGRQVASLVRD